MVAVVVVVCLLWNDCLISEFRLLGPHTSASPSIDANVTLMLWLPREIKATRRQRQWNHDDDDDDDGAARHRIIIVVVVIMIVFFFISAKVSPHLWLRWG